MMEWRYISGYARPYRINKEAVLQKQRRDGTWKDVAKYMQGRIRKGNAALVVSMQLAAGGSVHKSVNALMAEVFMGGVPKGYKVGHKNGMKTDCALENLFFTTQSEIAQKIAGRTRKSVEKVSRDGAVLCLYPSVTAAAKDNFMNRTTVQRCCNGVMKNPYFPFTFRWEQC